MIKKKHQCYEYMVNKRYYGGYWIYIFLFIKKIENNIIFTYYI